MSISQEIQRTSAWFAARKNRLTGSQAGAALGFSPWQKPADVIRAMVREYHGAESEFSAQIPADHGNRHERAAMLCFMRVTGLHVDDCGFFPYEDWSGASPDGITSDDEILELKCPFGLRHKKEAQFKTLKAQPHYYAQVQMEMLAAGKTKAYFFQYVPPIGDVFSPDYTEEQYSLEAHELDAEWLELNIPKLKEFYHLYLSERDNKEHLEPLRKVIETEHAQRIIDRIAEIDEATANLKEERESHMKSLIEIAENEDALICGHKLTKVTRAGSVSYAKAIKELAPDADLEKWRGKDSEYWRFS